MAVSGTRPQHKKVRQATCLSLDLKTPVDQDLIIDEVPVSSILDLRTTKGTDSNHFLVVAKKRNCFCTVNSRHCARWVAVGAQRVFIEIKIQKQRKGLSKRPAYKILWLLLCERLKLEHYPVPSDLATLQLIMYARCSKSFKIHMGKESTHIITSSIWKLPSTARRGATLEN